MSFFLYRQAELVRTRTADGTDVQASIVPEGEAGEATKKPLPV
jgi:hypothetical protein